MNTHADILTRHFGGCTPTSIHYPEVLLRAFMTPEVALFMHIKVYLVIKISKKVFVFSVIKFYKQVFMSQSQHLK